MIMSDHGFTFFNRAVGLNNWLEQQGLLTKIHAMGLNALYVNPGPEHDALVETVREKLLAWRDPKDGAAVVETVSDTHAPSPDLIVGYARGYRASWETGIGGFSNSILEDNIDPWTADHCINAADVPGVLFTTRKLRVTDPSLKDLPVSILSLYGLPPGPGMTGRPVY
jgi:predicted AlkP superfamily phosphohydrolase/phosphomutase